MRPCIQVLFVLIQVPASLKHLSKEQLITEGGVIAEASSSSEVYSLHPIGTFETIPSSSLHPSPLQPVSSVLKFLYIVTSSSGRDATTQVFCNVYVKLPAFTPCILLSILPVKPCTGRSKSLKLDAYPSPAT